MLPRPEACHQKVLVPFLLSVFILFECLLANRVIVRVRIWIQKSPRIFGYRAFPQIVREMSNKKGDELMKQVNCPIAMFHIGGVEIEQILSLQQDW